MRNRRDFYTPLLPFDEPLTDDQEKDPKETFDLAILQNNKKSLTQKEILLDLLANRLAAYLSREDKLPTNLPLLKLLPSINKPNKKEGQIKLNEEQLAELLKELGAQVETNPKYLGRSLYRVTISQNLANKLLNDKK